jgi:hypothetical protein
MAILKGIRSISDVYRDMDLLVNITDGSEAYHKEADELVCELLRIVSHSSSNKTAMLTIADNYRKIITYHERFK